MKSKIAMLLMIVQVTISCCQQEKKVVYAGDTGIQKVVRGPINENWGADLRLITPDSDTLRLNCPCDTFDIWGYTCEEFDGNNPTHLMYTVYMSYSSALAWGSGYWPDFANDYLNESFTNDEFHQTVLAYIAAQKDSCDYENSCYDIPLIVICNADSSVTTTFPDFCPNP